MGARVYYLGWGRLRERVHASWPTRALLWLLQWTGWAFLRLEGPAWQSIAPRLRNAFPQIQGDRRWRPGDPLRLLIQAAWLSLVRLVPKASKRRQRLAEANRQRIAELRGAAGRGRLRYLRAMSDAPSEFWNSRFAGWFGQRVRALSPRSRHLLTLLIGLLTLGLAALCITQPFTYVAQFVFVLLLWIIALLVRRMQGRYATLVLVVLSITVSCRYLWWRYTATLNWNSTFDLVCGVILLAAETYSWLVLMLGYVQVAWPLRRRPAPLPADVRQWPTVDVLIPTYNEDLALVRHTVYAAMGLDWPADKLRIHILDDGKREEFRAFAERAGVNYITRTDNRHAKAGNLNHALTLIDGVREAILDGAAQIVGPAFVSLLCICIVFVPMFLLDGIAGYLFRPMALAVIFAMASSFVLSRTLVPTMALYLLRPHRVEGGAGHHPEDAFLNHHEGDHPQPPRARMAATLVRWQQRFEAGFSATRDRYHALLGLSLAHRGRFLLGFMASVLVSFALLPTLGQDFFPATEAGALSLHVRLPLGTRIEETAAAFDRIEARIRQELPPQEIDAIVDNLGLPMTGINMAYSATGTIGPQDGDIQVSLKPGHGDAAEYARRLREVLPSAFPGASFAFLPADTSSQILNFGSPAPLDVRIAGPDAAGNRAYAQELQRRLRHVPGLVDLRLQQPDGYPTLKVEVDRLRANGLGITERDVTNSMVASLAGSGQVAPTFWLSPKNGISYSVVAATPQYRMDSLAALQALPVTGSGGGVPQVLGGLAEIQRGSSSAVVTHYNVQPTLDVYASVQGRDLGAVAADVQKIIDGMAGQRPRGTEVGLHGQIDALHVAFTGLGYGLLAAIVLIYLLIVINFQSWTDPFVIITALPAGLAGVVWMLFLTHTTLSVPALTGAILCMGVATANSILVVSFCRERLAEHGDAVKAALEGGFTRFRPVCMTALAMILGMLPTALSTEQNAPLGRAVIGGLLLATCATLLFVPVVFALAHSRKTRTAPAGEPLHV